MQNPQLIAIAAVAVLCWFWLIVRCHHRERIKDREYCDDVCVVPTMRPCRDSPAKCSFHPRARAFQHGTEKRGGINHYPTTRKPNIRPPAQGSRRKP